MTHTTETVATTLEREALPTIDRWMKRVQEISELIRIPLSHADRTGHLPRLLEELITRLRLTKDAERPDTLSAHDHGKVRFGQGYTVPMLVEESRLLQVSIFDTLHRHQESLDASLMIEDVISIADECDAQLKETVEGFTELEKLAKRGGVMQLKHGEKIVKCANRESETSEQYCEVCGQVCFRIITISDAGGQSRNVLLCGKHFMETVHESRSHSCPESL